MGKFIDLTGQRFGKLVVIERDGRDRNNLVLWKCRCDCGNIISTRGQDLRRGKSTNCGCRHKEILEERNYRHGMAGSRPYRIWKNMKTRCYNPASSSYQDYGARGIRICDRWLESFKNFWADMQEDYADNLEIDRIDHDGNYCRENCRWASDTIQNRNKRNNHYISTIFGAYSMAELAETFHIPYDTVKSRIQHGWTGNEILAGRRFNAQR